jgi:hypothetical protein
MSSLSHSSLYLPLLRMMIRRDTDTQLRMGLASLRTRGQVSNFQIVSRIAKLS